MDTDTGPDGKRDRRHVSGKTREVVLAKVSTLERERADHAGPPEPGDPIDTVGDWIGYWLKHIAVRRAKARTVRSYGLVMHREVLPRVGPVRLRDLREHHLDWLYGSMLAGGATAAGLRDVRRVLSAALNEAVARELVVRNVARRAAIPRYMSPEVEPLSVHETQRIFAVAASMPNGAAWVVALALGLRRAEVLGLHWADVDLGAGTISIRRTLQKEPWTHGCADPIVCTFDQHDGRCTPSCVAHARYCPERHGGLVFGTPKSAAGYRTVVMPRSLHALMQVHHDQQRPLAGRARREGGLVFRNDRGQPLDPDNHTKLWKAVLKAAGVRDARLHDARHSAATFLLMQDVDARTTKAIMGWAHAETAERYQHVVTPLRRDAACKIERLLWSDESDGNAGG